MDDTLGFSDLVLALSPLLAVLWLWGIGRVLRDLRRITVTGPELARCGLPRGPLRPTSIRRFAVWQRMPASRGLPAR